MTAAPAARRRMTQEEYLDWEEHQEEKHEWYDGEVFPMNREPDGPHGMAGGTEAHARIISNVHFLLRQAIAGKGCTVYTDALRVQIEARGLFTYPDLSVVCGEARFTSERRTSLTNPTVLVEVLSASTERYDRTTKRQFYETLPSLQAYVLVAQDYAGVDVLVRADRRWHLLSEDEAGRVEIAPLGVMLDLAAVYEGVTFPDPATLPYPTPRPRLPGR